jgi:hypothetical protein
MSLEVDIHHVYPLDPQNRCVGRTTGQKGLPPLCRTSVKEDILAGLKKHVWSLSLGFKCAVGSNMKSKPCLFRHRTCAWPINLSDAPFRATLRSGSKESDAWQSWDCHRFYHGRLNPSWSLQVLVTLVMMSGLVSSGRCYNQGTFSNSQ